MLLWLPISVTILKFPNIFAGRLFLLLIPEIDDYAFKYRTFVRTKQEPADVQNGLIFKRGRVFLQKGFG